MIQEVKMYQAVCDGCSKVFRFSRKDDGVFPSYKEAKEVIEHFEWIVDGDKFEWIVDGDKCYCYDCQEWDKETKSYKPKKKE